MTRATNIKTFVCKNPNSKFKSILNQDIINGKASANFVFNPNDENAYWPLKVSLIELINDGWEQVDGEV